MAPARPDGSAGRVAAIVPLGVCRTVHADAAISRRGGRGVRHPVLVGNHQGDGVRGLLPWRSGAPTTELPANRGLRMARASVPDADAMVGRSRNYRDGTQRQCFLRASAAAGYLLLLVRARAGVESARMVP